jgi:hypothetical protein
VSGETRTPKATRSERAPYANSGQSHTHTNGAVAKALNLAPPRYQHGALPSYELRDFSANRRAELKWCHLRGSNARPRPYQVRALPTELRRPVGDPDAAADEPGPASLVNNHCRWRRSNGLANWCPQQGLGLRASAYNAAALHLSYAGMVPATRIELATFALRVHCATAAPRRQ